MSNLLIKAVIRRLFAFTSREKALEKSESILRRYLKLSDGLGMEAGRVCVQVPPMQLFSIGYLFNPLFENLIYTSSLPLLSQIKYGENRYSC
jgi:hypothetical protein